MASLHYDITGHDESLKCLLRKPIVCPLEITIWTKTHNGGGLWLMVYEKPKSKQEQINYEFLKLDVK